MEYFTFMGILNSGRISILYTYHSNIENMKALTRCTDILYYYFNASTEILFAYIIQIVDIGRRSASHIELILSCCYNILYEKNKKIMDDFKLFEYF